MESNNKLYLSDEESGIVLVSDPQSDYINLIVDGSDLKVSKDAAKLIWKYQEIVDAEKFLDEILSDDAEVRDDMPTYAEMYNTRKYRLVELNYEPLVELSINDWFDLLDE